MHVDPGLRREDEAARRDAHLVGARLRLEPALPRARPGRRRAPARPTPLAYVLPRDEPEAAPRRDTCIDATRGYERFASARRYWILGQATRQKKQRWSVGAQRARLVEGLSVGFRACRVFEEPGRVAPRLVEMATDELSPGDVVIQRVHWSGINYKDALAVTGRGKILKHFPLERRHRRGRRRRVVRGRALRGRRLRARAGHGPRREPRRRLRGAAARARRLDRPAARGPDAARVDGRSAPPASPPRSRWSRMELLGQRPELGPIAVTGRHRRRRLDRGLDARGPRLRGHRRVGPARARRLPARPRGGRGPDPRRARARLAAARGRALRRRDRQRRRRRCSRASCATCPRGAQVACIGMAASPDSRAASSR